MTGADDLAVGPLGSPGSLAAVAGGGGVVGGHIPVHAASLSDAAGSPALVAISCALLQLIASTRPTRR